MKLIIDTEYKTTIYKDVMKIKVFDKLKLTIRIDNDNASEVTVDIPLNASVVIVDDYNEEM